MRILSLFLTGTPAACICKGSSFSTACYLADLVAQPATSATLVQNRLRTQARTEFPQGFLLTQQRHHRVVARGRGETIHRWEFITHERFLKIGALFPFLLADKIQ